MARDKQSKMSRDNPASNLRTLRVTFFGPFGFCLYGRGSDRHFDVHVPQLTGHEYWVGSPRKTETILDPLPEGRGQLDNVDQVMKVKLPSSELALVLDSNDDDTKIVGIGKTRNTFCFPLPSAILLNSIYSSTVSHEKDLQSGSTIIRNSLPTKFPLCTLSRNARCQNLQFQAAIRNNRKGNTAGYRATLTRTAPTSISRLVRLR